MESYGDMSLLHSRTSSSQEIASWLYNVSMLLQYSMNTSDTGLPSYQQCEKD